MHRMTTMSTNSALSESNGPQNTLIYAFVDTNVLLHYKFFRHIDWPTALGVSEVVLVFAQVVLHELDNKKWSGSRREKARARSVLKALDEFKLSTDKVTVTAGFKIMAIGTEPEDELFERHRLQPTVPDDRLQASLLGFVAGRGDVIRAALVTADMGLRVKARPRQIEVLVPKDDLIEKDEPDETERRLSAARQEIVALRHAVPELRLTIDGESLLERDVRLVKPFDARTLGRLLGNWRSRHPRTELPPDPSAQTGAAGILRGIRSSLIVLQEGEGAKEHNCKIDSVYKDYERYIQEWPSNVNGHRRSLGLRFILENSGTAPADDVHLTIWTDADGLWLEELPSMPEPPVVPEPRNPFDFSSSYGGPYFDPSDIIFADADLAGPTVVEDDPKRVKYWTKRTTHHMPVELPIVYFRFNADECVMSFKINYKLIAANLRMPRMGTINVKLDVTKLESPPLPPGG